MLPWRSSRGPDATANKEGTNETVDHIPLMTSSENGDSLTLSLDGADQKSDSLHLAPQKATSDKHHVTTVSISSPTDSCKTDQAPAKNSLSQSRGTESRPPSQIHSYLPKHPKQQPIISYEKNKSVRIFVKEVPPPDLLLTTNGKRHSRLQDAEEDDFEEGWKRKSFSEKNRNVNTWGSDSNTSPNHHEYDRSDKNKEEEEGIKVRPLLETNWRNSSRASVLDEPPSSDDCQRSTSTLVNTNPSKINKLTNECQRGGISVFCGVAVVIGSAACLRLPGMLLTYGVGSFLTAFFVCLLAVALPLGYLESGLAQFSNNSVIGIWSLVPLFRGVGWSTVVGCLYWGATTVGLAAPWFHYLIAQNEPSLLQVSAGCRLFNDTDFDSLSYYRHCVYNLSSTWENGLDLRLNWSLPAGLITILMVASLSVAGGPFLLALISSTGSLLALIGYGAQLYGVFYELSSKTKDATQTQEITQLLKLLIPDTQRLVHPQIWLAAMSQALLSLGSGAGMLLNHSANNIFRHPLKRHLWFLSALTVIVTLVVALTTVLETKIYVGQLSLENVNIYTSSALHSESKYSVANALLQESVTGPSKTVGERCVLYTYSLSDFSCLDVAPGVVKGTPFILSSYLSSVVMREYPLWLSRLLKNLIFLGFLGAGVATSCICMHVGVVAAREARSLPPAAAALILMGVLSLVAAPMSTQAGAALIHLVDNYVLTPGLLWPPFATLIALALCHGITKIRKDMTFMLESLVSWVWLPFWALVLPIVFLMLTLWSFCTAWEDLGVVDEPEWRLAIVWSLRIGLLISIPVTAIIVINSQLAYGFKDKILSSLQSSREWGDWGPQDPIEHYNWRRWREDETQSYASLERRLASKSRPLTYTHSTLSSTSSSTIGRLRAKYRAQSQPQVCDL